MPKHKVQSIPLPGSGKRKKEVVLASRKKKSANSTSFKPGNQYRFSEGTSGGNVGGKPKEHRLLSKTLRAMLSDPAPMAVAQAFGLGRNASWSQCISARLLRQAVSGDLEAARLIGVLSEGAHPRIGGFDDDYLIDSRAPLPPPLLQVVFVDAEDGRPKQSQAVIDAALGLPASSEPSA